MIRTPLCDLLGIEYPVFQGGMAWIADGKLAAAVSEGGGLGIIAARQRHRETRLREQIQVAKSLTGTSLWGEHHADEPLCGRGGPGGG